MNESIKNFYNRSEENKNIIKDIIKKKDFAGLKDKKIIIGFISLLLILTTVFGIYSLVKFLKTDIFLTTEKESYLHWEFIKISAKI